VGAYRDSTTREHGYALSGAMFSAIDFPGAVFGTEARGISNTVLIVGSYQETGGRGHGFLLGGGIFRTIDFPGALFTDANDINSAGQVVGAYLDGGGRHGYLLSDNRFSTIDFAGAQDTVALGINDAAQIVGFYANATGFHGYLATPVSMAVPDPPTLLLIAIGALSAILCRRTGGTAVVSAVRPRRRGADLAGQPQAHTR
jgi:hypothetical protein